MIGGVSLGITRHRAAIFASVGLVVAAILFMAAYVASNISDGSLELTRQAAFRFFVFAFIAGVVSVASLWLVTALINVVFRALFTITIVLAPAEAASGNDAPLQSNEFNNGSLRQSRDIESAILLAGLILIFLPLSFVALRSLATEYAQAPKTFSQAITLPPDGETYMARFTVSDNVDATESVPARLTVERVAGPVSSALPGHATVKYGAQVVAPNLTSAPIYAPIFGSSLQSMRWDWTIAPPVAEKDTAMRAGRQAISAAVIVYSGDGHILDEVVGPTVSINVHEPFTWSSVLSGVAPLLSFVLGLGTLIIGFMKRGSDGAPGAAKA